MYAAGEGVPKDFVKAYMWHSLAATSGSSAYEKLRDLLGDMMTDKQIEPRRVFRRARQVSSVLAGR